MEDFMRQKGCEQTARDTARALQQKRFHAGDKRSRAHRDADFERRTRAAGIESAADEDMDTFRRRLTRTISMFHNDWEGCPLRLCQRMKGCMAPHCKCTNHADDPPPTEEQVAFMQVSLRRALDTLIESHGGRDAFEAACEEEARSAARIHKKS
jgi:hypothetical protein